MKMSGKWEWYDEQVGKEWQNVAAYALLTWITNLDM
jgi:hypothetical protein